MKKQKHATIYRDYQKAVFSSGEDEEVQWFNAIAIEYNCVLLPISKRSRKIVWSVPGKEKGTAYGFGRANVWITQNMDAIDS